MADASTLERLGSDNAERPSSFVATPERLSRYLELKSEEVTAQMKSVDGRQQLFDQMMVCEDDIRKDHADFHPEALRGQLDAAGEALQANEIYLQDIKSPEKKGIFKRAWENVKSFAVKHPVVTTLTAAGLVAGGVAGGLYMAGYWETVMAYVGLSKIAGIAEAASELAPVMPETPMLPDGGIYDVPPPTTPPGEVPFIPH